MGIKKIDMDEIKEKNIKNATFETKCKKLEKINKNNYIAILEYSSKDYSEKQIIEILREQLKQCSEVNNERVIENNGFIEVHYECNKKISKNFFSLIYSDSTVEKIKILIDDAKGEIYVKPAKITQENFGYIVESEIISLDFNKDKAEEILEFLIKKMLPNADIINLEIKDDILTYSIITKRKDISMEQLILQLSEREYLQLLSCNIIVGYKEDGKPYILDLSITPHILITGKTGGGKTRLAKAIISMHIRRFGNGFFEYLSIVLNKDEFPIFNNSQCCIGRYESNTKEQLEAINNKLDEIIDNMGKRENHFKGGNGGDIQGYLGINRNRKVFIKPCFIIIDEFPIIQAKIEEKGDDKIIYQNILSKIKRIAKEGRSSGYYLMILAQSGTADSIPSIIKDNCFKISLKLDSKAKATVVLGEAAANLVVKLKPMQAAVVDQTGKTIVISVPYVADNEIKKLIDPNILYSKILTNKTEEEIIGDNKDKKEKPIFNLSKEELINEIQNKLKGEDKKEEYIKLILKELDLSETEKTNIKQECMQEKINSIKKQKLQDKESESKNKNNDDGNSRMIRPF